jgi:hypothetical protein
MKRSEAINHIVNVLRLTGNHYCDDGRDEQDAERILKRLELIGMLPPPKQTDPVTSYLIYCYYDKVEEKEEGGQWILDRDNSQLWDDE